MRTWCSNGTPTFKEAYSRFYFESMQMLSCVLILSCYYAVAHSDRWLNYKRPTPNPDKK